MYGARRALSLLFDYSFSRRKSNLDEVIIQYFPERMCDLTAVLIDGQIKNTAYNVR